MSGSAVQYSSADITDCGISDVGLVLIATRDPLGELTRQITKQNYDSIGIYWLTTIDGCEKLAYMMIHNGEFIKPAVGQLEPSLDQLALRNPLVVRMDLRPLDPQGCTCQEELQKLKIKFRSEAAKLSTARVDKDTTEIIYQLLGHRVERPTTAKTGLELINTLICNMGVDQLVPQSSHTEETCPDEQPLTATADGFARLMGLAGSGLRTQVVSNPNVANKLLASYVSPNCLFGNKIYRIKLPCHSEAEITKALEAARVRQGPFLQKLAADFVGLSATNPLFFQTVVTGINEEQTEKATTVLKLQHELSDLNVLLFELLATLCPPADPAPTNDLIAQINCHLAELIKCPLVLPPYASSCPCNPGDATTTPAPAVVPPVAPSTTTNTIKAMGDDVLISVYHEVKSKDDATLLKEVETEMLARRLL